MTLLPGAMYFDSKMLLRNNCWT